MEGDGLPFDAVGSEPLRGGDTCTASRLTLADGSALFAKERRRAPTDQSLRSGWDVVLTAEANGLRWLRQAEATGGAPVPEVVESSEARLALTWIEPGRPTPEAAEQFGRQLAGTHRHGAARFGAPWAGAIGPLPLDNRPLDPEGGQGWGSFYAARRIEPFLRLAADAGSIDEGGQRAVEQVIDRIAELSGPDEPPARIHGDLWSGNLVWSAKCRVWLVDPAAHGGHRETDLAMLGLFGTPHLDRILGAYREEWALAPGFQNRVALHQLHPLLVHAALFGGSYGARAGAAARQVLSRN
ncbi:MAG TPA: fructosamine kinase family protein [Acidimicrobiales bacterium]|nr:fructosamine kinase family protein [Acidimicrobiales bacterium]